MDVNSILYRRNYYILTLLTFIVMTIRRLNHIQKKKNYFNLFCFCLQECVKKKALMSILMVRNVDRDEANKVINKVFNKCYNDLEPIGRIPRRNSHDPEKALAESYLYGYTN